MQQDLYTAATALHASGVNVIPVRANGTKAPAFQGWQNHTTTERDLHEWFGGDQPAFIAMGAVTGPASGNLELIEIEGPYAHRVAELRDLAHNSGLGGLWDTIHHGWAEVSPSGGIHWFYRVAGDAIPGNKKIAQGARTMVDGVNVVPTIAETRGTGGQVVLAPTPGIAHTKPDCGCVGPCEPWRLAAGGPATVPTITADQRRDLHTIFATLDERPTAPEPARRPGGIVGQADSQRAMLDGTSPGDDYENKTTWPSILEPAGWRILFTHGRTTYWVRPGKDHGISATTGHAEDRDRLWVFSSSTEFPTEESITKFSAYAILNHGGDHAKAASKLRSDGHGTERHIQHPSVAMAAGAAPFPEAPALVPEPFQFDMTSGSIMEAPATVADPVEHPPIGSVVEAGSNLAYLPAPAADLGEGLHVVTLSLPLTDDANAMELIRLYGSRLRYNSDQGRWLAWAGHRWEVQPANGGYARELAKSTARQLPEDGPEGSVKTVKHKRYSLSERGISSLLNQARTDPMITVTTDDLDSHPWELNTPGGIVDLRTGELSPPDPAKLHTRSTTCTPDATADPNVFNAFLAQTFPDPLIKAYVQRLAGYSSIGEVLAHILPFAHGSGGNGKGVLLETLRGVLGSYAGSAPSGFLMATTYQQHATELADLSGRRFVICSEVNEADKFDEAKMKALTGGDTVKARFMRQDFFEFRPTHHLWLMGNHQPAVESGGDGFWRRLRLIPFTHSVPDDAKVEDLQGILIREHGPAVLNWIIAGAVEYGKHGLMEPPAVRAATQQYSADIDTVGRFLEDECLTSPAVASHASKVSDIREAYERWCHEAGERPLAGRSFTSQLARHGIATGRNAPKGTGGSRMYGGIVLKPRQESLDERASGRPGY